MKPFLALFFGEVISSCEKFGGNDGAEENEGGNDEEKLLLLLFAAAAEVSNKLKECNSLAAEVAGEKISGENEFVGDEILSSDSSNSSSLRRKG